MDTREEAKGQEPQGVALAYTLHKNIGQVQEEIQKVKAEVKTAHFAERVAFVGTLVVYFVFIWGLYIMICGVLPLGWMPIGRKCLPYQCLPCWDCRCL